MITAASSDFSPPCAVRANPHKHPFSAVSSCVTNLPLLHVRTERRVESPSLTPPCLPPTLFSRPSFHFDLNNTCNTMTRISSSSTFLPPPKPIDQPFFRRPQSRCRFLDICVLDLLSIFPTVLPPPFDQRFDFLRPRCSGLVLSCFASL